MQKQHISNQRTDKKDYSIRIKEKILTLENLRYVYEKVEKLASACINEIPELINGTKSKNPEKKIKSLEFQKKNTFKAQPKE